MDVGSVVLRVARMYTVGLFVLAVLTLVWVVDPIVAWTPEIAGVWFALGGFGALVALTLLLVQLSR